MKIINENQGAELIENGQGVDSFIFINADLRSIGYTIVVFLAIITVFVALGKLSQK